MDTLKQLTVDEIQGYLSKGAALLPHIYEHMLIRLIEMEHNEKACLLPITIFDMYHLRLKRRLEYRISQHQARQVKRRVA